MKIKRTYALVAPLLCAALLNIIFFCGCSKSDEEQILDVMNGYLEAQGYDDFNASYQFLAPQTKNEISEEEWVAKQEKGINSVRLMRDPRLTNVVINGDTASAELRYIGIPSKVLTASLYKIYSTNFQLPLERIAELAEEDLAENFDKLSVPQVMKVAFFRTPKGWSMFMDLGGDIDEQSIDHSPGD